MGISISFLRQLGWRAFFSQQLTIEELESSRPGRAIAVHRDSVAVLGEDGPTRAALPAALRAAPLSAQIAVGDWLLVETSAPRVLRVLDRYSLVQRLAAGEDARPQLVAANLDTLFVVASCNEDFNLPRLERYLVLARDAHVRPVIVLTKVDMCPDPQRYLDEVARIAPRVTVLAVDATSPQSVQALSPWTDAGQTAAFVGSSGVGKSTLTNTLLGADAQRTAGVREDDARGRHTTTARQMFALPSGAWIIDTPGMRELRLGAVESAVSVVFEDIEALARQCRFRDCRHMHEVGCALARAVADGRLDARRAASYLKLQRETVNAARTLREKREHERRQGRLHRGAQRLQRRQKGRY